MNYKSLYKRGLRYFDQDIENIIKSLESEESVCLSSAPNMGDTRLIDYLVYRISGNAKKWNIIYDSVSMLGESEIYKGIQEAHGKTSVLVIPDLFIKSDSFKKFFRKISSCKNPSIVLVTRIKYEKLSELNNLFLGCKPISYIKILKPLGLKSTQLVIETKRLLYNWRIPKKYECRIYKLSGGIIGLIKHICASIDREQALDLEELLDYPPIVKTLTELKSTFDELDAKDLKKLGLINSSGKIRGELLQRFLFPKKSLCIQQKRSILNDVLELFIRNKGKTIALDDIDQHINPNGDFSLWRMYKLVSRLRNAIKDRYELKNIRNVGYILKDSVNGKR